MEGLLIRDMKEEDIQCVYEILNSKYVKKYSCKEEIEDQRVAYFNWYKGMLNSPSYRVFVVTNLAGGIVGSVIFEIKGKKAVINIYFCEEVRGKGYSYYIIENTSEIVKEENGVKRIAAYILKENTLSKKIFEKLGYLYKGNANYKGLRHLYFLKEL